MGELSLLNGGYSVFFLDSYYLTHVSIKIHDSCAASVQPLSASLCLALSHVLPRCVLARVCTVKCSLKHERAKARKKGWGDPEGPDLMYSV